jgi:hypothetical protein
MKKSWWRDERDEKKKPWWEKLLVLCVALGIAGAIRFAYREIAYKKSIPIESTHPEWQVIGSTMMMFRGQSYTGDVYFDKLSLKKEEGKIIVWMRVKTHSPVVMRERGESYRWDEQIARWIIDCKAKTIEIDYFSLYWEGRKQHSGKWTDVKFQPEKEGTVFYTVYESVCF